MKIDQSVNSFTILGIRPTSDRKVIKKAYAEKCKTCHPESQLEEWKVLHEAFQIALQYAKNNSGKEIIIPEQKTDWFNENFYGEQIELEDDEYGDLFEQLDSEDDANVLRYKERFLTMLRSPQKKFGLITEQFWLQLFASEEYKRCREDEESLKALLKLANRGTYLFSSFEVIRNHLLELQVVFQNLNNHKLEQLLQDGIERLERRWELTRINKERMNRKNGRRWYVGWQNYWHLPLPLNFILFIPSAVALGLFVGGSWEELCKDFPLIAGLVFAMYLVSWLLHVNLKDDRWKRRNEETLIEFEEKTCKLLIGIFGFLGLLVGIFWIAHVTAPEEESVRLENYQVKDVLYAQYKEDVSSQNLERKERRYVFYLLETGEGTEAVFRLNQESRHSFEKALSDQQSLAVSGYSAEIYSDELIEDVGYYYIQAEQFLNMGAEELIELTKKQQYLKAASSWMNQNVFCVESFEQE